MKTSIETSQGLSRKLTVEIPAETVSAEFGAAFQSVQRSAVIKGFRKGKAPLQTIRAIYGDRIKQEVVQNLVQRAYASALQEHKLEPVSFPNIEFDAIEEATGFSFTAEFEVRPEVKFKQFENLPVKKSKVEINDEKIDEAIKNILESRTEFAPILEDRPAQKGDVAIIDFKGMVDGKPLDRGEAQGFQIELGGNQFIPGFEEGLVGMRIGGSGELNLSFPADYFEKELAGKPVQFAVTLKELKRKVLPELNDEFAKKLGPFQTVADLRADIRKDFETREEKRVKDEMRERILKELVDRNTVEVPNALVAEQKQALERDVEKRMKDEGHNEQAIADYKSKWGKDLDDMAKFMVQSSFLIDQLSRDHQLRANESDVDQKLNEYAKQTGIELSRLREFYGEEDRLSRLRYQLTEDKVVQFLISKAKIEES